MGLVRKEGIPPAVTIIGDTEKTPGIEFMRLNLYPDELAGVDIVGEEGYIDKLRKWFGSRILRGTALMFCPDPTIDRRLTHCYEPFLREIFKAVNPTRAVEIGTLYGVTTALLAHYCKEVITIDVNYQQTASYVSHFFGVNEKIKHVIIKGEADKKELLDSFDFDFAFIDALHTYDGVKSDFECVEKCGKVLFHDYGLPNHKGITRFVDELPKEDVMIYKPFALWERDSGKWNDANILH